MKKITITFVGLIILIFLSVFFVGRFKKDFSQKNYNSLNFNVLANYTQNETNYEALIKQSAMQTVIIFKKPEEVENLKFTFNGDDANVSFAGFEIDGDDENLSLLNYSVPKIIAKCFQNFVSKSSDEVEGLTEYGRYRVETDNGTKLPTTLKILDENINCTFKKA